MKLIIIIGRLNVFYLEPCVVLIRDGYPINVLTRLKEVSELVNIYCATANPIEIIFVETEQGRDIVGVGGKVHDPANHELVEFV
jgi:adenosine/AMP kinase